MQTKRGFVGVWVLIAILTGLAVLGGGAYYVVHQQSASQTSSDNFDSVQTLTNNQASQQTQPIQQKVSPKPNTNTTQTNSVATANWKTYENIAYGYSLAYPASSTVTEYNGRAFSSEKSEMKVGNIVVRVYTPGDSNIEICPTDGSHVTINGIDFTWRDASSDYSGMNSRQSVTEYCALRSKTVYTMTIFGAGNISTTQEPALATFKFIPIGDPSTHGMSKYTEPDFGFSFWYPSSWQVKTSWKLEGNVVSSPTMYKAETSDGSVVKSIIVEANDTVAIVIEELSYNENGWINIPFRDDFNLRASKNTFYYDTDTNKWMHTFTEYRQMPMQGSEVTYPIASDSTKSIDGLDVVNMNDADFRSLVPLGAKKALVIRGVDLDPKDGPFYATALAQTVAPLNSLSTNLNADQMMQIWKEKEHYAGIRVSE